MPGMVHLRERLRTSLWFVPSLFAVGAGVLAVALLALDHALAGTEPLFGFGGTPDGARSVLSAIAQSMLTFTGLVFSITMLVLQLASSQLSPRVTRTFLRDRGNQVVLGLFVATFVYTLIVLRDVRAPVADDTGFVPAISVWFAFALLLASVAAFIYYIDHMAQAIRATTVIVRIWEETVDAIERRLPANARDVPAVDEPEERAASIGAEPHPGRVIIKAPTAGVVVAVDDAAVLAVAARAGREVELVAAIGDFIPEGAPLAQLSGEWDRHAADDVRDAIAIGAERTLEQDVAFGFRQLVDIALRALSPGTNDPTTAVQALDRLHDLLRRLARRPIPRERRTSDGTVRLTMPATTWEELVRLAFDEIRIAGEGQIQVAQRLTVVLEDLLGQAPPDRGSALLVQQRALEASIARAFPDAIDRAFARDVATRAAARR
jgi:uncharacterized membrane protein